MFFPQILSEDLFGENSQAILAALNLRAIANLAIKNAALGADFNQTSHVEWRVAGYGNARLRNIHEPCVQILPSGIFGEYADRDRLVHREPGLASPVAVRRESDEELVAVRAAVKDLPFRGAVVHSKPKHCPAHETYWHTKVNADVRNIQ